ncbi:LysR family transcriptional regulator [Gryllotalpicola protaetiae]|uniref:LysR family transcriptional regulator n=1 Tax=Gryllotalpicola protaetiae TaxID=2419771 RepID=A0A387BP78_9MICO|nr:LysR family transcriptional regulator [Gryllotalpicola protaetiae]AYG04518.1 LysR family transcriptional regulator [Gryllotalpicola protaetiae]
MDGRQLEIFAAVAEESSFSRAARRLFAAQSTVSAAVRSLEQELGAKLFERSTRSVELTAFGETALSDARVALEAMERIRTLASPETAGLRGRVRLGIFSNLEFLDLPELLGRFHREHPLVNLRLVVSSAGSSGLLDDIRHGRLDVALVGLPAQDLAGLDATPLGEAEFTAVLPAGHPLASRRSLTLADLASEPFVDSPPGFGNRLAVDRAFEALGSPRTVVAEVPELPSVPRFVAQGLGVAVVPMITSMSGVDVVAVPLRDGPLWTLSAIAPLRHSAAADAMLELLQARRGGTPQATLR